MFKRSEAYYLKRRKRTRAKLRKWRERHYHVTAGRKARRYYALEKKYQELGKKWWAAHVPANFVDAPWGLDITDLPITMDDIRFTPWPTDAAHLERQRTPGTWEYRSIRVGEDKSVKVEFWKPADPKYVGRTGLGFIVRDGVVEIPTWVEEEERARLLEEFESERN